MTHAFYTVYQKTVHALLMQLSYKAEARTQIYALNNAMPIDFICIMQRSR